MHECHIAVMVDSGIRNGRYKTMRKDGRIGEIAILLLETLIFLDSASRASGFRLWPIPRSQTHLVLGAQHFYSNHQPPEHQHQQQHTPYSAMHETLHQPRCNCSGAPQWSPYPPTPQWLPTTQPTARWLPSTQLTLPWYPCLQPTPLWSPYPQPTPQWSLYPQPTTPPWLPLQEPTAQWLLLTFQRSPYPQPTAQTSSTQPRQTQTTPPRALPQQPQPPRPQSPQPRTSQQPKPTTRPVLPDRPYNLTQFPYIIPVPGKSLPDDGCARDMVLTQLNDNRELRCQKIMEQGPCQDGWWILINKDTLKGECLPQICPRGKVYIEEGGQCHDPADPSLCPAGRHALQTSFGQVGCTCAAGFYPDVREECQQVYSHNSCPIGQQLRFNDQYRLQCYISLCPPENPVPFRGKCMHFGEPCGTGSCELTLDTTTLEPKCAPMEATIEDGTKPKTQAERIRTEAKVCDMMPPNNQQIRNLLTEFIQITQAKHKAPAGSFVLHSGYLPPASPQQQQSSAVQKPQRRIDETTPAGTISESRRRRQKRSVFSTKPLSTCRPGAVTGRNYKCRQSVVPSSRSSTKKPSSPNYKCRKGKRLSARGKCVRERGKDSAFG